METATGSAFRLAPALASFVGRVDEALVGFLSEQRAILEGLDPQAGALADEVARLVRAGGKRIRPRFCYLGHRAARGGEGEPIVRAAAALELLHTFALVHDDVMDAAEERRGVETTHVRFARSGSAAAVRTAADLGRSVAILVGDLAAVWADVLLRTSGFGSDVLTPATEWFDRMRLEMAAGQFLDLTGDVDADEEARLHLAELKTGSYTVEGPLLIGASLAAAPPRVLEVLRAYARPVGEAFQLRDDVVDGAAGPETAERVSGLVDLALAALEKADLEPLATESLRALAGAMRLPVP